MAAKASQPSPTDDPQIRTILRWRWFILLISSSAIFIFELLEHRALNVHVALEIFIYGLTVPVATWFLLTLLARHMVQHASLSNDFEQHRRLSRQLARYQDRRELARFITRFPGTILPVDRVTLFQYDYLQTRMEFLDQWSVDGRFDKPPAYAPPTADAPYAWQLTHAPDLHQACVCPLMGDASEEHIGRCFCLPLVYDHLLVGLLRLQCSPGQTLSDRHKHFLNAISPHVALALALSIAFPKQMTEARHRERRRLAYDLHDSLAQQIGYLHLTLDRLAGDDRLEATSWLRAELDRLREVADASYHQVRDDLNLLRNQSDTDLAQALDEYILLIKPQVAFETSMHVSGTPMPLGPLTRHQVISMIQECLNNIQKHARARHASVELTWRTHHLDLTVSDDGVGFDPSVAPGPGHYGLSMLHERVRDLHGEMQITSGLESGTCISFIIPLRA